jgi:hypothetical protein
MNSERRDGLDSILDAALRDYSNRDPRIGFEQRILRRIRSSPPIRRSPWWIAWVLVPMSVTAVVLSVITVGKHSPKVQSVPQVAHVTFLPAPTVPTRRTKPPKQKRLPKPETLTDGERALLQFARTNPEQAGELVADSGQMKDLTIEPLKIEALP